MLASLPLSWNCSILSLLMIKILFVLVNWEEGDSISSYFCKLKLVFWILISHFELNLRHKYTWLNEVYGRVELDVVLSLSLSHKLKSKNRFFFCVNTLGIPCGINFFFFFVNYVNIFHPLLNDKNYVDTITKGWGLNWHKWNVRD